MRKFLLVTMLLIVALLSGCSQSDDAGFDDYLSFDSILVYRSSTLTFINTDQSNVLYGTGNVPIDYMINAEYSKEFTLSEKEAYVSILAILDEIDTTFTSFSYTLIPSYTSKDIEQYAVNTGIELTITDIITFNKIKTEMKVQIDSNHVTILTKQKYVELRIGRELTPDELEGFNILQEHYYGLVMSSGIGYSFETNTFDELLELFNDEINYVPSQEVQVKLESAYLIIHSLVTE